MERTGYSMHVSKRPIKTAFLVNPDTATQLHLDAIFEYNKRKWGGRYNPIVLTDGQALTDPWWALLETIDPDVVVTLTPLAPPLLESIDRRLNPYSIESLNQDDPYFHVRTQDEGLSILPTADNVRLAEYSPSQPTLVLFDLAPTTDPFVRQFIDRTFGIFPGDLATSRALEHTRSQIFPISDRASLAAALRELSTYRTFTYPIQLSALPNFLPDAYAHRDAEVFTAVIGDSLADLVYFWNRPLSVSFWKRTFLTQAWIPTELAQDPSLVPALAAWLRRGADPGGTMNQRLRYVTCSLADTDLRTMTTSLAPNLHMPYTIHTLAPPDSTETHPEPLRASPPDDSDLYTVGALSAQIVLTEPPLPKGSGDCWMAEVRLTYSNPLYRNYITDFWWQFPRRNHLAHHIFRAPSRIAKNGYPAVRMVRGKRVLSISLPTELQLFRQVLVQANTPWYTNDLRTSLVPVPFRQALPSDKGRYLGGLLDLFGGLTFAREIFQSRYWRLMIRLLSGLKQTDDAQLNIIRNSLAKHLNKTSTQPAAVTAEWLARYVLQRAREVGPQSRELPFSVFLREATKEHDVFNNAQPPQDKIPFLEGDLTHTMSQLIESRVLLLGIRPRCPSCGYSAWHSLEEAQHTLTCTGCTARFPISTEPEWSYKLNSLVQAASENHGLIPVVLVLADLLFSCWSSFLFTVSLALFDTDDADPLGDLDIVCVKDGKLMIGEIKQSADQFTQSIFDNMGVIAKRVRPDVLLFSSLDATPTRFVRERIEALHSELSSIGTRVVWHQLPADTFSAGPIR